MMIITRICLALTLYAAVASSAFIAHAGTGPTNGHWTELSMQVYTLNGILHKLQLWQGATIPPSKDTQNPNLSIIKVRSITPDLPLRGSVPYILTDAMTARAQPRAHAGEKPRPRMRFACYGDTENFPRPVYAVDFAVRSGTDDIFIVMTKSIMMHVQFFIFKASLKNSPGPFPFTFTTKNYAHWPKSPPAIAEHRETLRKGFCGIALIHVFLKGSSLLIYGRREDPKCPAVYIEYELNKRTWHDLTSKKEIAVINKLVEIADKGSHALRGK